MKIVRLFRYLVATTLRSLWQSRWLHASSAATIAATFLIFGGTYLLFRNIRHSLFESKGTSHLSVYFREGSEESTKKELLDRYCKVSFIRSCTFRSIEAAKAEFIRANPELEPAVRSLSKIPFPASIEMELDPSFRNTEAISKFAKDLQTVPGVEGLDDGGVWLSSWLDFLELVDALMKSVGMILLLSLTVVISNTIQLVVYARRDEVEILNLIGASYLSLRLPFIFEGMVQGMLGVAVSLFLLDLFSFWISQTIGNSQIWMSDLLLTFSLHDHFMLILIGALVGMIGSTLAVRRYLHT